MGIKVYTGKRSCLMSSRASAKEAKSGGPGWKAARPQGRPGLAPGYADAVRFSATPHGWPVGPAAHSTVTSYGFLNVRED